MKQTFDYLENVPNIAATVCDKEGIVLYQNKRARLAEEQRILEQQEELIVDDINELLNKKQNYWKQMLHEKVK